MVSGGVRTMLMVLFCKVLSVMVRVPPEKVMPYWQFVIWLYWKVAFAGPQQAPP